MADEQEIRYLGDVQRLVFNPGDTVVLTVEERISQDQAILLKSQLVSILGGDVKVLILSDGMKIGVLGEAA